ncbi:MAG: gliding motility-associated C-terminal domain-containing protein [Flavobacterium sp.]|nr:gliding motility-associated C-terminal domain-containing protein [Flavobacterium sp.]
MTIKQFKYALLIFIIPLAIFGQDVSLFQQFNGRFDFTFIGNTLNPGENTNMDIPEINTSSAATLNLSPNDVVEKAYLYWAGCGPGDFEVSLNNTTITPDRIFQYQRTSNGNVFNYFSAFSDITSLVRTTGNGTYTLSELDLNDWITYHFNNRTNFGGWAIAIVYKNNNLPFNQINVYDGLQAVPNAISINLDSLNVVDNQNAKIGFIAWEGDKNIQVNETLSINSIPLQNLPLNPVNNAFNGTNSITNDASLYNMDLDIYDIQNTVQVGDTSALIQLGSGQDFVMINAIVTKLNSQMPDAQITIDDVAIRCNSREINLQYTSSNFDATKALPANVPIAIYVNDVLLTSTQTQNQIAVNGTESGTIVLQIPTEIPSPFSLKFVIDDNGNGQGIVEEILEDNNTSIYNITFIQSTELQPLSDITSCNEGLGSGTFDFSSYENTVKQNPTDVVTFFLSIEELLTNTNPISDIVNFKATTTPMSIFVKVDNGNCFQFTSFQLKTIKCRPVVYNYVSVNNDGTNDTFTIKGLRDVFFNFKLEIYNRWGKLVWIGNNNTPNWDGKATEGIIVNNTEITDGTYYYSLELNDEDYPEPLYGYLFVGR